MKEKGKCLILLFCMAFEISRFNVSLGKRNCWLLDLKVFFQGEEVERKEMFENYFPVPTAVVSGWML